MSSMNTQTPGKTGRAYWRSLDELADTPEYRQFLEKEFADYSPQQIVSSPSRRAFMKIMGASMALAGAVGLPGCRRWPEQKLAPYAKRPEGRIPGVPEQYATIFDLGGVAQPLLVSSTDGRPNKIEGNPTHPQSLGAADVYSQASVLGMYDPHRSRYVKVRGEDGQQVASTWDAFAVVMDQVAADGGRGVAILSEATHSPTVADLRTRLTSALPAAKWYEWEPLTRANEVEGARQAFGRPVRTVLALDKAKVIACFDADILGSHPAALRYSRDWAKGRDATSGAMNRTYVAESHFSITGTNADVRLPIPSSKVGDLLRALAGALGSDAGAAAKATENAANFIHDLAADLKANRGASVIVAGPSQPPEVHALVHLLNEQLGNVGSTITYVDEGATPDAPSHLQQITRLAEQMAAGQVKTLLILGGNPVYDAPANLDFAALLAKVPLTAHLSFYEDETSNLCTWHLPRSYYLEAWGDGRSWTGLVSVQQPLILPLYATRSPIEVLAMLLKDEVRTGYDLVRRTFAASLPAAQFEKAWRQVLHDGFVPGSEFKPAQVRARNVAAPQARPLADDEFELVLVQDSKLYDGRFANNAWLQELPEPLSKITWDNAAWIAPMTAKRLGITRGDMVRIEVGGRAIDVPVFVMPGQNPATITLSLGYGRNSAGYVGNGVGFDAYQLRTTDNMWVTPGVKITPTGRAYELVTTQDHFALDAIGFAERQRRVFGNLVRSATLDQYKHLDEHAHGDEPATFDNPHVAAPAAMHAPTIESPEDASADIGRKVPLQLWDAPVEFEGHAWGMAIDLNKCIGCSACVIACQAENNVPVVGKDQVKQNREMHWIRIDRYFSGDPETPESMQAVHQPVTCHHCETAPCESVCPVAATVHDTEGLNVMVYNRCVGTRYCSNNCPYKVRRFNWFDWHSKPVKGDMFSGTFLGMPDQQQLEKVDPVRRMGYNPEVTVRMRGVMEKCTFCTQRIKAATIPAKNAWTQGKRESWRVNDGEITPACAQTCPTEAILFGDLNDPNSRVREAYKSDRAYAMLKELNTRPRNRYMALISNPSPSFVEAVPSSIVPHEPAGHDAPGTPGNDHAPANSEKHG